MKDDLGEVAAFIAVVIAICVITVASIGHLDTSERTDACSHAVDVTACVKAAR